jgi:hypothetical protein
MNERHAAQSTGAHRPRGTCGNGLRLKRAVAADTCDARTRSSAGRLARGSLVFVRLVRFRFRYRGQFPAEYHTPHEEDGHAEGA